MVVATDSNMDPQKTILDKERTNERMNGLLVIEDEHAYKRSKSLR